MENTQNLLIDFTQPNHGIEKNCSNCVFKVTNCPSDQAPFCHCSGLSQWQADPLFIPSDDNFSTLEDFLVDKQIHEDASIFVDFLINSFIK